MGWKAMMGFAVALLGAPPALADSHYHIRQMAWTEADERGFGEFIAAIGASGCRTDVPDGANALAVLDTLADAASSATYRIHPELEEPGESDFYSPALTPKSIRPGTVIYDPNGHLAIVWQVQPDGASATSMPIPTIP
jgi:hypothetical protein